MAKAREIPELIYMEQRALAFMRAWPDVPEVLRPVYARFYDHGLIWSDPNAESDGGWPSSLRLTNQGQMLKDIVDSRSLNWFSIPELSDFMEVRFDGDRRIFTDQEPPPGVPGSCPAHPAQRPRGLKNAMRRLEQAMDRLETTVRKSLPRGGARGK